MSADTMPRPRKKRGDYLNVIPHDCLCGGKTVRGGEMVRGATEQYRWCARCRELEQFEVPEVCGLDERRVRRDAFTDVLAACVVFLMKRKREGRLYV